MQVRPSVLLQPIEYKFGTWPLGDLRNNVRPGGAVGRTDKMFNDSECRVGSEIDDETRLRSDVRPLAGDVDEMYLLINPRAARDTQTGAVDSEGRIECC